MQQVESSSSEKLQRTLEWFAANAQSDIAHLPNGFTAFAYWARLYTITETDTTVAVVWFVNAAAFKHVDADVLDDHQVWYTVSESAASIEIKDRVIAVWYIDDGVHFDWSGQFARFNSDLYDFRSEYGLPQRALTYTHVDLNGLIERVRLRVQL